MKRTRATAVLLLLACTDLPAADLVRIVRYKLSAGDLASGEAAAEAWLKKLGSAYFRRRYWYLVPFLGRVRAISKWIVGDAGDRAK